MSSTATLAGPTSNGAAEIADPWHGGQPLLADLVVICTGNLKLASLDVAPRSALHASWRHPLGRLRLGLARILTTAAR